MTNSTSGANVHTYKSAKDKVQKSGRSAEGKTIQLDETS